VVGKGATVTRQLTEMNRASNSTEAVAAVGALTELIRVECGDMDATRRIPPVVVTALKKAGVFRLMAPAEIGGAETDPVTFLNVVETASHADGSVDGAS
jgi:3-hydroxy-9,10-secoandrosta-1,3,5(10)-triene-9,17-dione monooxygenase